MRSYKIVWVNVGQSMDFTFMGMDRSRREDIKKDVCRDGRFYIPADAKMEGL